jgi:hypothetical protein
VKRTGAVAVAKAEPRKSQGLLSGARLFYDHRCTATSNARGVMLPWDHLAKETFHVLSMQGGAFRPPLLLLIKPDCTWEKLFYVSPAYPNEAGAGICHAKRYHHQNGSSYEISQTR